MKTSDYPQQNVSVRQAAEIMGCSTGTVCRLIADGTFSPITYTGTKRYIDLAEIHEYMRQRKSFARRSTDKGQLRRNLQLTIRRHKGEQACPRT